ncbi:Transmembrane nucleoporin, partial [Spiromyces aspiralis]
EAQFSWWLGHVIVVVFGTLYYFRRLFDPVSAASCYYTAFVGAFVSYVIVIYKTYGPPQMQLAFLQRLIIDENVEYFILAFYWWSQPTIFVTLLPFIVFSLFHAMGYLRQTIIPTFFPTVAAEIRAAKANEKNTGGSATAGGTQLSLPAKASLLLNTWYNRYYLAAFAKVAVWEVAVIETWLILGALTFQTPFLAPLFYSQFLRLRYQLSAPTRTAFYKVRVFLDRHLLTPQVPESISSIYVKIRDFLISTAEQMNQSAPGQSASSR